MEKKNIEFGDWQRLVFGHAPTDFMIEVFFRTLIMYSLLLLVLHLLGKRMTAQASILEFSVLLTLGAIISLPMQEPSRGLLPGIIILFGVLAFQRISNRLSYKYRKVETTLQGDVSLLVKDGQLILEEMQKSGVSHEQLFSQLRLKGVRHLGQVQRVYLEAYGIFSVFFYDNPRPGLSILPIKDQELLNAVSRSEQSSVCNNCGHTEKESHDEKCPDCGNKDWVKAIDQESKDFG